MLLIVEDEMPTQMELYYYAGVFIFPLAPPRFALVVFIGKARHRDNGGQEKGLSIYMASRPRFFHTLFDFIYLNIGGFDLANFTSYNRRHRFRM